MVLIGAVGGLLVAGGTLADETGAMRVPFPDGQRVKGACVVNGTDFKAENDFEFACYDKDRNLLENPSFESGVRYFHDEKAAADLSPNLVRGDARTGLYSYKLGSFHTMSLPVRANRPHTFSFYAKCLKAMQKTVQVDVRTYSLGSSKVADEKIVVKGQDWQRYEMTFVPKLNAVSVILGGGNGDVLVDDLQFECAAKASDYVGAPIGLELETDSPERHYAEPGQPLHARFTVRGAAGSRGEIKAEVEDYFGHRRFAGTLAYAIPESGETSVPLCGDEVFADRGTYAIRLTIAPEKGRAWRDFFRLSVFDYCNGKAKHMALHNGVSVWASPKAQNEVASPKYFRQLLATGQAPKFYSVENRGHRFTPEEKAATLSRYRPLGSVNFESILTPNDGKEMEKLGFGNWRKMKKYSPELLKFIEQRACENVRDNPQVDVWEVAGEAVGNVKTAMDGDYAEFAKIVHAGRAGALRANPKAVVCCYGTCNNSETGRREIRDFLAAWKKAYPGEDPGPVEVHPYRPNPDDPDVDLDYQLLFADLDKLGFKGLESYGFEGGYFWPLLLPSWGGIAPWHGTIEKDAFSIVGNPSYDVGWGERVAAAMWIRYELQGYKYASRLKTSASWGVRFCDLDDPNAVWVANSVLVNFLGDSTFLKDVRFAPKSRAYVFDDGHGRAVAAFWRYSREMDYGTEGSTSLELDLTGLDATIYDVMGNEIKVKGKAKGEGEGRMKLPLSNFPMYVRVPREQAEKLAAAFLTARTPELKSSPVEIQAKPSSEKTVAVTVVNPLSKPVSGSVRFGASETPFALDPVRSTTLELPMPKALEAGRVSVIDVPLVAKIGGKDYTVPCSFRVLPVRHVKPGFDWKDVPVTQMPNNVTPCQNPRKMRAPQPWGGPDDLSAACQLAWNEEALYYRLVVKDDAFAVDLTDKWGVYSWYANDSVQLFFDTFGDGPAKFMTGQTGPDENDMSYELLPTNETTAVVFRRRAPDFQLTGGVGWGLRPDTIETNVVCTFRWDPVAKTRTYETAFPRFYIQPLSLEKGATPGFATMVFDREDPAEPSKQFLTDVDKANGGGVNKPYTYTTLLFID